MIARLRLFALLAAGAFALGSVPAGAEAGNPWTMPGTLRIGITLAPNTLNPVLQTNQLEFELNRLAFDGLLQYEADGSLEPKLATAIPSVANGGISRDGLTLRYHLRHNVKWHDGAPFTSRDVVFTWHAIMNPANNVNTRLGYDEIANIDTPDDFTVVIHMKRPFAPALTAIFGASIVIPEHLLGKYADLNHVDFNGAPVGTGPFRVVRWLRGDRIEYEANDAYYLGAPKLRKIVVHLIPADNTAATQIRTHEIDWYERAQTVTFRDLRDVAGYRALTLYQNAYRMLIFNTTHWPLDDVRVRRAIAAAIDKRLLVERVAFGTAEAATADVGPSSWAFDPGVKPIPFDPARARAELAKLGFNPGSDGILVKDGKRVTLTLVYAAAQRETEAVVILIQDMLKKIGIEADVHGYDPTMLFAGATGILSSSKFDLDVSAFINQPDPDDSRLLTCANMAPHGFNYSRYCSPAMEAAQAESLSTLDRGKRKHAISKIEHLVVDDVPILFLWWPRELHVVNSDLKGIDERGMASNFPHRWSI